MISRGIFITLEGPEGSGKSTHAGRLVEQMQAAGYSVLATREPGGTRMGEGLRRLLQHDDSGEPVSPETELFLFLASRAQLVRQFIQPALTKGIHVVCDRFADSTTAYQGYGRGYDVETILRLNDLATGGLAPDLTFLLDVDVRAGFERLRQRNAQNGASKDRIERETLVFHERVRAGYHQLARRWPARFRVIDVSGPVAEVQTGIWAIVRGMLEHSGNTSADRDAAQH